MYVHCSVHTHIGNIVGYILSARILTAYYKILEKAVAGKAFSRGGITNFIKVIKLNPDTVNKLLSKLSCDNALIQICFIIRIHILVKASWGDGVTAGFGLQKHLHKPEGLTSLVEGGGALCRNTVTVGGYLQKLCFTGFICTSRCLLSC